MKVTLPFFILLTVTGFTSCNFNKHDSEVDNLNHWDSLIITDDNRIRYSINNDSDSSAIYFFHIGSIFTGRPKKVSIDTFKVYFTKSEKDSLEHIIEDMILHPVQAKSFCSEFVGTAVFSIVRGQSEQSIGYNSVCDWTILSPKTKQLHGILEQQLKTIKPRNQEKNTTKKAAN